MFRPNGRAVVPDRQNVTDSKFAAIRDDQPPIVMEASAKIVTRKVGTGTDFPFNRYGGGNPYQSPFSLHFYPEIRLKTDARPRRIASLILPGRSIIFR